MQYKLSVLLLLLTVGVSTHEVSKPGVGVMFGDKAHELKLLADVITGQNITTNIVCISTPADASNISSLQLGIHSLTVLEYDNVLYYDQHVITDLARIHVHDNAAPLYILTPPDSRYVYDSVDTVDAIRTVDQTGRVVIIYPKHVDIDTFPQAIYNVYFLVPDAAVERYGLYEVCRYCRAGEDMVELGNTWRYGAGFRRPLVLGDSFRGSFYGAMLRMGCAFYSNFVKRHEKYTLHGQWYYRKNRHGTTRMLESGRGNAIL